MPEGDALHRAAARLRPLVGERLEAESPNPRGQATGVARVVDGRVLEGVDAVGKHLLLRFEGGVVLRSHLRMNGRWRLDPRGSERRGLPWLVLRGREWEATQWNGPVLTLEKRAVGRLGPDLLADDTEVGGRRRAPAPRRSVASRGRGARRPAARGRDRKRVACRGPLARAHLALAAPRETSRTTSWRTRSPGRASTCARRFAGAGRREPVYRRAGRPCPRCGTPVSSRGLGDMNRTAYWCGSLSALGRVALLAVAAEHVARRRVEEVQPLRVEARAPFVRQ